MIRITRVLFATALLTAALAGCKEQHTTYSDAEYVMFADTMSVNMILQDQEYFEVPIASTTACDYDRNFGIEIIDREHDAVEGRDYRLLDNTVTIKAGERAASVRIRADYDRMNSSDTLQVALRLVMPEQLVWDLYGDRTNVKMVKSCPFSLDDFICAGSDGTGWCMVTSTFIYNFPGVDNNSYQRLIRTEKHPTEPNTLILRNWLYDGYDVTMRFDPEDPARPFVSMDRDQVLSDEQSVFGQINGDDKILVTSSPNRLSYFNACDHFVSLWILVYVENLGEPVGNVGTFYNVMEWVTEEEAERLQREEGM